MKSKQETERQSLYIPRDLMQVLKDRAQAHDRSFNKEIIQMIRQYLRHEQQENTNQSA